MVVFIIMYICCHQKLEVELLCIVCHVFCVCAVVFMSVFFWVSVSVYGLMVIWARLLFLCVWVKCWRRRCLCVFEWMSVCVCKVWWCGRRRWCGWLTEISVKGKRFIILPFIVDTQYQSARAHSRQGGATYKLKFPLSICSSLVGAAYSHLGDGPRAS